jgi:cobalamin biosynthesis Mg chelatase CobN
LSYLKSKNLGLISWALDPGVMMIGDNPEDPTSYNGAKSQTCDASNGKASAPAAVTPGLTGKAARKAARQAEKKASRGKNKLESPNSLQSNTNGPGATILAFFRANSHPATAVEQPATPTTSSRSSNTWLLIVVVILLLLVLLAFVVRLCRWRPRSAHR